MVNFLPFTKKNLIQNTTNLINYTLNIVKEKYWFTSENKCNKIVRNIYIYNLDVSKISIGQFNS